MMSRKKPVIVVITGAESTGKSVLAMKLASHYGVPFITEYAREHIGKLNRPYTYRDLESIAVMQQAQMLAALKLNQRLVIFDTWLIITMVWFEVVYGKVPAWLPDTIASAPVGLFLVCSTDIPWMPDPLRENGGEMREKLHRRYIELIGEYGFRSGHVSGEGAARYQMGVDYIDSIIQ